MYLTWPLAGASKLHVTSKDPGTRLSRRVCDPRVFLRMDRGTKGNSQSPKKIILEGACSVVSTSFATPWAVAHQAPLSMGFARLLSPWDLPGKNTGVGCHSPLQRLLPTSRLNQSPLHLLRWQADSLPRITWEAPVLEQWLANTTAHWNHQWGFKNNSGSRPHSRLLKQNAWGWGAGIPTSFEALSQ